MEQREISKGFNYAVATVLGLAFSGALFLLAWFNALDVETREFTLESESIINRVARGVTASDDAANDVAVFFEAMPRVSSMAFRRYSRSIIERYPFIRSVSYHPLSRANEDGFSGSGDAAVDNSQAPVQRSHSNELHKLGYSLPCLYQVAGEPDQGLQVGYDLAAESDFLEAIDKAMTHEGAFPTPAFSFNGQGKSYLLIKAVHSQDDSDGDPVSDRLVEGVVVVMLDPAALVDQLPAGKALSMLLFSESEGVTGRQLLFAKSNSTRQADGVGTIKSFQEESLVQFPHYSMRLIVGKGLYWSDIDFGLIFTGLILGAGGTLLLIALARAKEAQARALRERNMEIEKQVQQQTEELERTRDQALEASRVKSEFLASMSHEIRTPLNAIIGMGDLLSETKLTAGQKKYVDVFKQAGEALLSQVNDILDLSKIEAEQLELEEIDFNLRELAEGVTDICALDAHKKGLEIACHVEPGVSEFVRGDPPRLRQVVLNLLGNAIKFTEHGEVVVGVIQVPGAVGKCNLRFSVSDTGIGIAEEKLEAIFGSFTQADSSTTRRYGGSGLGLTISKRLVDQMGGSIWVESTEGKGSTFSFEIPLSFALDPIQHEQEPLPDLSDQKVLVIDDNATNRLVVKETLESRGVSVTQAQDGATGLEALHKAHREGKDFDLILTDHRMPGMDGFQVAAAIKRAGNGSNAVMMLSSSSLSSDIAKARELGLDAYLVKPIKSTELLKAVSGRLATTARSNAKKPADTDGAKEKTASILLVEDTLDNRLLIKAYLKRTPYHIEEAKNGAEAVEIFKAGKFDLVFMDVQMPVMDGYAATRAIRDWERANKRSPTPIVALTAHAVKEDIETSLQAGCDAHLTKPIKKATLIDAIRRFAG